MGADCSTSRATILLIVELYTVYSIYVNELIDLDWLGIELLQGTPDQCECEELEKRGVEEEGRLMETLVLAQM